MMYHFMLPFWLVSYIIFSVFILKIEKMEGKQILISKNYLQENWFWNLQFKLVLPVDMTKDHIQIA